MTEAQLQIKVLALLKSRGVLCWKVESPSSCGLPDVLAVYGGQTRFIELKHPNGRGRLSPLQQRTIARLRAQGAQVDIINSIEEARQIATELTHTGAERGD